MPMPRSEFVNVVQLSSDFISLLIKFQLKFPELGINVYFIFSY